MKKVLFFLVASLVLVSCGNAAKEEVKTEVADTLVTVTEVVADSAATEAVATEVPAATEAPAAH